MGILDLSSWSAPPFEGLENADPTQMRQGRVATRWKSTASPADIYCYLRARFGRPNGILTYVVPPASNNIFHWHYYFTSGEEDLHIKGVSSRVEFLAFASGRISDREWSELLVRMKADFRSFGPGMKDIRNGLEHWKVFVNPYYRLEKIISELHARLDAIDLEFSDLPELPEKAEEMDKFREAMDELGKRYSEAAEFGMSLRMMIPVWAEAFVNLLIFLLAKPDLRESRRLYENVLRQEIDVRILGLHLHCNGFATPLDRESNEVRDFLRVMNARNDLLHGNVDPKRLAIDEIYFDGKMPIFKRYQTMSERSFVPRLRLLEPQDVKDDILRVSTFILYVLRQLEPPIKEEVEIYMENEFPGWREDNGRPGILFDNGVVDYSIPLAEK